MNIRSAWAQIWQEHGRSRIISRCVVGVAFRNAVCMGAKIETELGSGDASVARVMDTFRP